MRIPLDYYQILGVSFDASPEQIQESFEDRIQQLPKQQYSSFAIASRKKLLQEAHGILQNPKRRQEHDQALFPEQSAITQPSDGGDLESSLKGIDIDSDHLAGALILLIEFGEFDTVIALGLDHLNRQIDLDQMPTEAGPNDDDVALAVAIAHLELGREHWQQGDCEEAGQCLKTGLKILRDEGKFLDIQAEIELDLSKLRPYRVLDLLALDLDDPNRSEGLSLLQDMLDDRGGMEGNGGDDQSGLSVNDFLLFMQQLRDHLTVDEQLSLFQAEAMRPSSVAQYLGMFAHVAKGISEYDPQPISQAKALLSNLSDRQDLALEQGMCSLLLGQPDAAMYCAQQSTDEEAIALITEYSEGAPDIIPGLYLYTSQWLQEEVYPYFRDLNHQTVSLENYFNDADVQRQLSDLEPDLPNIDNSWDADGVDAKWQKWLEETTHDEAVRSEPVISEDVDSHDTRVTSSESEQLDGDSWFASITSGRSEGAADLRWREPPHESPSAPTVKHQPVKHKKKLSAQATTASLPTNNVETLEKRPPQKSKPTQTKIWITGAAAILLGISALWGLAALARLFQSSSNPSVSPTNPPATDGVLDSSPESSPSDNAQLPEAPAVAANGTLTDAAAQAIVEAWQKVKADALGESHQINQLSQILVEPALSRWTYSANIDQDEGNYTRYTLKNLQVSSVKMTSETEATVRAKIEEVRDQFVAGAAEPFASLEDAYEVDYFLKSVEGKWQITEMEVIE